MNPFARPSRRTMLAIDVVLVAWIVGWALMGWWIAREVRDLKALSTTVGMAGEALERTGGLLGGLDSVPFLGDDVGDVAERVAETGRSARQNARTSRENVEDLAVILGVAIALIPSVPLAAIYVPMRLAWRRELQAVRRALVRGDERLDRFLAQRALQNLSYDRLVAVSPDPWLDLQEGRFDALADAELDRLGLTRPRARRP